MSEKRLILRALVSERLTAAAEEIFALVERTIVEYEEELCRSKEENQRKQQLLDSMTASLQHIHGSVMEMKGKSPTDKEEVVGEIDETQTTIIKEEDIKQEEDEQQQEFTFYSAKNSEDDQLQGFFSRKTQEEDEDQTDEDWDAPCSSSFQPGEHEADVDYFSQVYMQALERNEHSTTRRSAVRIQPKCPECEQEFDGKEELQSHMMEVHGGDKPISCPVCARTFTRNGSLKLHMAMHMHEKPYSCPVCSRGFTQKGNLRSHMAQHTGEKPFSCTECDARFPIKRTLLRHMKLHTGERPYSCPYCDKTFTRKEHVRLHMAVHTGQSTPKKRRAMSARGERGEDQGDRGSGPDSSNDSSGPALYTTISEGH